AEYVGADNARHTPVMLHRAVIGSMERFIGILIEHYAGAFPLWLAPQQVVVMNITERHAAYAESVVKRLMQLSFRAAADLRNEKISYKIREHSRRSCPTNCWWATRKCRLTWWPCARAAAKTSGP